jgi:hypothetical protein
LIEIVLRLLQICCRQHNSAAAEIVDKNRVVADSEIINATLVVVDSEIGGSYGIVSGFITSFWSSVSLTLGFPLLMLLARGGPRTPQIPLHSSFIIKQWNINTSSFSKVFSIHSFQHRHLA